jgi:ubiquinone/menaquinone biosynthesis C-methylase UbiE
MSDGPVKDTLDEWQETAVYWARHHQIIRAMFEPVTRELIEQAQIREEQWILDVAGGAGEPSLGIARTVGPRGLVMCTDPVAEMLDAAKREALSHGARNIQFRQCTADALPFADNSFNAAVCRLGVMFFPDPVAGLREMLRVTMPGGRVALAVWGKSELNPYSYLVTEVVSRHVPSSPPDPNAPDAFRFAEPGKLVSVLKEAGASDVTERLLEFDMAAPISVEQFWLMRSEISETLREKLRSVSEEERLRIAAEVQEAVRPYFPNDQMKFPSQMIVVTGSTR